MCVSHTLSLPLIAKLANSTIPTKDVYHALLIARLAKIRLISASLVLTLVSFLRMVNAFFPVEMETSVAMKAVTTRTIEIVMGAHPPVKLNQDIGALDRLLFVN